MTALSETQGVNCFSLWFKAVQRCSTGALCRMKCACSWVAILLVVVGACSRKAPEIAASADLPPSARTADAPPFARELSLLYPQAELYRVANAGAAKEAPGIIVQKTNHALDDVVRYYEDVLRRHGFTQTTRLVQTGGALLQYERQVASAPSRRELVSVDISKLPYADNLLIRLGRSEVDYARGQ